MVAGGPVLIAFLGALSTCSAARKNDAQRPSQLKKDCEFGKASSLADDTILHQCIYPLTDSIHIQVTRSKKAWLGVAFADGHDHGITGAPFVVGLPETDAIRILNLGEMEVSENDAYAISDRLRHADIWQNSTHTVLSVSLEQKRIDGVGATQHRSFVLVVASGVDNEWGMEEFLISCHVEEELIGLLEKDQGTFRDSLSRRLDEEETDEPTQRPTPAPGDVPTEVPTEESEPPHKSLWAVHGSLMTLSWGFCIPLAIGSSIIRDLFPDGVWLTIHKAFNCLALVFAVTAFGMAFYGVRDTEGKPGSARRGLESIMEESHRFVGFIVVVLGLIQAVTGVVRPQASEEVIDVQAEQENGEQSTAARASLRYIVENRSTRRKVWELQHRLLGMGLIAGSWYNIHRGISLFEDRFGNIFEDEDRSATEIFWGGIIGLVVSFLVLATIARVFS